ncbi:MAG: DUF5928 domain-containing protein [Pseudomonadota bacterium]
MTQIAYLILAHKDADGLAERARMLAQFGDAVAIHFDRNAPPSAFSRLQSALAGTARVAFAPRVRCGWGEWSLVQATLNLLRTALETFPEATHFYLLSGDCTPIKPRAHIAQLLGAVDRDFIEHKDFLESDWIRTGLKEERLIYRHYVNERKNKRLFYALMHAQRRLGLARAAPRGLRIQIGSQWWVLRRKTALRVLDYADTHRSVLRFFRTTWIPDEIFFQTIVAHLTPRSELENRPLTFFAFSDYGLPMVLYDDHADLLEREGHLFARKVASGADGLRRRMAEIYAAPADTAADGVDLRRLFGYFTWLGRHGRRGAPRIWEAGRDIGDGRRVGVVLCKDWDLGKRFVAQANGFMPAFGYLFDEEVAGLPPLGGLSQPRAKRRLHRRAFLHLLFSALNTDQLIFCLDPGQTDILDDLARDPCQVWTLELATPLTDAFMTAHARRIGLMPEHGSGAKTRDVIGALRNQIALERQAVATNPGLVHRSICPQTDPAETVAQVAAFLDVGADQLDGRFDATRIFA